jgi:hypothetical protein
MDDVAHGLEVAAKLRSDLIGTIVCIGAGKQYLTTAQGEGIRRSQSCLQSLALGVTQRTREDRFSHTKEDKLLPIILLGYALGWPLFLFIVFYMLLNLTNALTLEYFQPPFVLILLTLGLMASGPAPAPSPRTVESPP